MTNFIRLFYRNLRRNKTFSIIAIAGFTLSLTIVLLLAAFVSYEVSYDRFHIHIDTLYRLVLENGSCQLNEDDITYVQNDYPEIEAVCRYNNYDGTLTGKEQTVHLQSLLQTEPAFFSMFDVDILQGDPQTALDCKDNILLSDETAKLLFGDVNPVGEMLTLNHDLSLRVTAVYKSMPQNSSFQPEAIAHRDTKAMVSRSEIDGKVTFFNRFVVMLNPNSDPDALQAKLSTDLQEHELEQSDLKLVPFHKSYMNTNLESTHTRHTNLSLILILAGIAVIIVIISGLNYIILFTANNLARLKEIGLKKTIGANSKQIFFQFLMESVILCFISFFIALAVAQLGHPVFENIVGKSYPLTGIFGLPVFAAMLAGVLLVAVLSGWLPAVMVSHFSPLTLFRSGKAGGSMKIKSGLLAVQYGVSMILIIALLVISRQIDFIKNKDLGFESEQLIRLDVHWRLTDKLPILKQELLKNPQIVDVTASHGGPGQIFYRTGWQDAAEAGWKNHVPVIHADTDFFKVFNANVLIGRTFTPDEKEDVMVINETAWNLVGWTSLEGKMIDNVPVIGVIRDIHVESMRRTIGPTFFVHKKGFYYSWLSLRLRPGNMSETIKFMQKTWKEICPEFAFNYFFYDEWIDSMYKTEEQLGYAIRLFVIIAIFIAGLGSLGVVQFTTHRRTKEIGIRKVNGAGVTEIIRLLNMDFVKWVTIAFCCAVPAGYFLMRLWLQIFAYRTPLSWWIFASAGLISLGIAAVTVSWQTWRAARRSPVEALRYE